MNINAIRAKLQKLQSNAPGDNSFWRPDEGTDHHVRILPISGEEIPFRETYWHWNVGGKSALCPKYTHGDDCPICELVSKMYDESDRTKDAGLRSQASSLRAKIRPYIPIVDRADSELTPKWWPTNKTVYTEVLTIIANPDYGDITNVKAGHDMIVTKHPAEPGRMYGMTKIVPRPKQTALASSKEDTENILNSVPSSDDFMKAKSYADLKEMIDNWINDTNTVDASKIDNSVGVEQYTSKNDSTEKVATSDISDLDTALEDLMG